VARLKNPRETILRGASSVTSAAHHCENLWPELTRGKILAGEASIEIECLIVAISGTPVSGVYRRQLLALLHLESQPLQLAIAFHLEHDRRARFESLHHRT
jgi:hypothetical protein